MVLLVRHARAGSRKHWEGPDIERPLSKKGWRQAQSFESGSWKLNWNW